MAKLTNRQIERLRVVLAHLERAAKYLADERISVARREARPTTTLHFLPQSTRPKELSPAKEREPYFLYEVDKDIGSDLTGLQMGIDLLAAFIVRPTAQDQDAAEDSQNGRDRRSYTGNL